MHAACVDHQVFRVTTVSLTVFDISYGLLCWQELQPLVYPLAQVLLGAVRLVPTPRYFPLRLRCLRALLALGKALHRFIPLSPLLLEMLQVTPNPALIFMQFLLCPDCCELSFCKAAGPWQDAIPVHCPVPVAAGDAADNITLLGANSCVVS